MSDENNESGQNEETVNSDASDTVEETAATSETSAEQTQAAADEDTVVDASASATDDADATEQSKSETAGSGHASRHDVAPGDSAELIAKSISGKDVNIDALLKVPVSLSIEVGRTRMSLSELLDTQEGSVIELDRHLDEPLDILVNGALIAHGIVVLANEKFGLQITDIISLEERARSL